MMSVTAAVSVCSSGQGRPMRKRKLKNSSNTSRAKARVGAPAVSPVELTIEEIRETLASPQRSQPTECFDDYLLADDEDWLLFLEPAVFKNPQAALSLARLLCTLKESIGSGPEGARRTSFTLSDGIRIAFNYTEAYRLALRLFILYLEGRLRVEDEPQQLLNAAIARASPEKN
jgi:hypothetical protein